MRRRRPMFIAIGVLLLAAAAALGSLLAAAKREPAFYAAANQPGDYDTHEQLGPSWSPASWTCKTTSAREDEWGEHVHRGGSQRVLHRERGAEGAGSPTSLPRGFHSPRIAIEGDRLRLELTVPRGVLEHRRLAGVEGVAGGRRDCERRGGGSVRTAVPVGCRSGPQSILDKIADVARESSIEVTWYRNKSNPVGLFKFFAKQPRTTSQVLTLEVKDGKIVVAGRSFMDRAPGRQIGAARRRAGQVTPSRPRRAEITARPTSFARVQIDLDAIRFVREPFTRAGVVPRHAPAARRTPAPRNRVVQEAVIEVPAPRRYRRPQPEVPRATATRKGTPFSFHQKIPVREGPVVQEDDEPRHGSCCL